MKAIVLHEYGDAGQLKYEDVEKPQPGDDEILVKVAAASLNPIDWKLRSGHLKAFMPLRLPYILGRDVAGEVVEVGSSVKGFKPGDRVMALVQHAYAEFLSDKAALFTKVPEGMALQTAAAVPLVTLTGAQLIERGVQPKAGQTILVTGALGGVGRTAVFVAKQHGATAIAGVRGRQKSEAESIGADRVVAIDDDNEIASLPELDGVADTVGGTIVPKLIAKLKEGGVYASVLGAPQDTGGKKIRTESVYCQPDAERLHTLAENVRDGKLSIPISKTFPLSEAAEAHRVGEKGGTGKLLLIP